MAEPEVQERWRPTRTSLVAGVVVIAGFLLTDSVFILIFGPLLASGVALLFAGKKSERSEDVQEVSMTGE